MERTLTCVQDSSQHLAKHKSQKHELAGGLSVCRTPWRVRFARWRQLRRERYALQHLSDDLLKDIGISREAVHKEAKRPFWDDRGWRR